MMTSRMREGNEGREGKHLLENVECEGPLLLLCLRVWVLHKLLPDQELVVRGGCTVLHNVFDRLLHIIVDKPRVAAAIEVRKCDSQLALHPLLRGSAPSAHP